jgi:hypothetical protein
MADPSPAASARVRTRSARLAGLSPRWTPGSGCRGRLESGFRRNDGGGNGYRGPVGTRGVVEPLPVRPPAGAHECRRTAHAAILAAALVLMAVPALAGGPAPYTEEAARKIDAAAARISVPPPETNASPAERLRGALEFTREAYEEAGYDLDATLVSVAHDLQSHPERIPRQGMTTVNHVVVWLHVMMTQCSREQVDCLEFFTPDTAAAVRTLMRITKFSP